MALLNFKYGQGTPATYEQGTIYVSSDNKKIYIGDPTSTSGAGFCAGDFIEVPVAASKGQADALAAVKGPQQNVLYLTHNTTDGYDLWKYTGSTFVNLTQTGSILALIQTLTGVVEGINTGLSNYVTKAEAPGYADILTKTAAAGIYETQGTAADAIAAYNTATVQPIASDLNQLTQTVANNKTAVENTLKDYSTTAQMNTAIGDAKSEIIGGATTITTLKAAEDAIGEAKAAAKTADDKAVAADGKAVTAQGAAEAAQTTANQGVTDAAAAKKAADDAQADADAAQADATKALNKLGGINDDSTVGAALEALKEEILGDGNTGNTIAGALAAAEAAQAAADAAQKAADDAQADADQGIADAKAAQETADEAIAKLDGVNETVGKSIAAAKAEILGADHTGTVKEAAAAAETAQTAAEAAQGDATQALADAAAAKKAADDAQADATEALTALGAVTDVAGAIATAKSEILGGSTSTLKAAETAIETLDTKVDDLIEDIDNLSNIMNFIGVTETALTDKDTQVPAIDGKADYDPKAGDVVVSGDSEFVYDGSQWRLIGNTSAEMDLITGLGERLTNLENKEGTSALVAAVDQNIDDIEDHETRLTAAEKDIDDVQAQLTWGSFTSL